MGVKQTVFGSKEEKKYFQKLQRAWGEKLNIYHNIPFLNVFTARDELVDKDFNIFKITEEDYDKLKKTSIDFVVCDKNDKPIICIEFDGLQQGFNVGVDYLIPENKNERKGRKYFLELKLRVAHGSFFPYFILGAEQFRSISNSTYLSIVDALIGEVLATQETIKSINEGFKPSDCGYNDEEFENLTEEQKKEIIEDWFCNIEIEADYKNNPIFQKVTELSVETKSHGHKITFTTDNERNPDIWTWVECEVESIKFGKESAKVFLPNFNTPFCYFTSHIAIETAHLLTLTKLKQKIISKQGRRAR